MRFGEYIKINRQKKGLLMRELAALIEADIAVISKIENSKRLPTFTQVKRLSVALELNYNHLNDLHLKEEIKRIQEVFKKKQARKKYLKWQQSITMIKYY